MVVQEASFLRDRSYLSAAISHFFIDVLNNGRILLVAILAVSLGLSNAQVGIFLLLYNVGASLSQPVFGWLADRSGARWLVVGGVGWMILFFALAAVVPEWPALLCLIVASLGSGAFHPGGTKVASQISITRRTQATAIFFMAGQIGLFVGPILTGGLLEAFGRPGYLALPLLALVAFLGGWRWLQDDVRRRDVRRRDVRRRDGRSDALHRRDPLPQEEAHPAGESDQGRLLRVLPALLVIAFSYNTVSYSAQNFAPKLFTEWGYSPGYLGWIAGLYMMGSAIGGLVGGSLADRIGGKPVILGAMLGAVLPVYFYIPAGDFWRFPLLLLAGFFGGMPHSIVVLRVQNLLPERRALASGLTLGFMFFGGAVGSYVLGVVADSVGLDRALQGSALLMLLAFAATLLLPRRRPAQTSPKVV
jgi:FSR family fosmidomycin resistance protein-like MFS transporter